MTAPQNKTMPERKSLGPILRIITVAGIWKIVYVMKNSSDVMLYPLLDAFMSKSPCILGGLA